MSYAVVHDTIEAGQAPIVRHIFVGPTLAKAESVYEAHRKSDRFLRECDDSGIFNGRIKCRTRKQSVMLSPKQMKALTAGELSGIAAPGERVTSFARFSGAVIAGQLAAMGARYATKRLLANDPETGKTASTFVGIGAFWLIGGLAWVALTRKYPEAA